MNNFFYPYRKRRVGHHDGALDAYVDGGHGVRVEACGTRTSLSPVYGALGGPVCSAVSSYHFQSISFILLILFILPF